MQGLLIICLLGGESIGYFLIAEFKDTETAILDEVLSVIKDHAKTEEYRIDMIQLFQDFLFSQSSAGY